MVLNVLEFGLDLQAAVDAPRTHHQWFPDVLVLEGKGWPEDALKALGDMGHKWRLADRQGNANSILVDPAGGGSAGHVRVPRRGGRAAGVAQARWGTSGGTAARRLRV